MDTIQQLAAIQAEFKTFIEKYRGKNSELDFAALAG
jgi:hypothetical protein